MLCTVLDWPSMSSVSVADCGPIVPGDHRQCRNLDAVVHVRDAVIDKGFDILVIDVLLAVGERLEAVEGVFHRVVAEIVAEFLQLRFEGGAARVLAHHKRRLTDADRLRRHDLVGLGVLQHAILMDAALVREGIPADDRLVVLHGKIRHRGDEL